MAIMQVNTVFIKVFNPPSCREGRKTSIENLKGLETSSQKKGAQIYQFRKKLLWLLKLT